jgi:hypothetical protein
MPEQFSSFLAAVVAVPYQLEQPDTADYLVQK